MEPKPAPPKVKPKKKIISFGTGPAADWKLIFLSAASLLIILAAVDAAVYLRIRTAEGPTVAADESRTLNLDALRREVLYYQNRQGQLDKILKGTSTPLNIPADPSL